MKVHHLNTATLCPGSAWLVNGRGGLLSRARLVCHVLLLETARGLTLVDTGLGLGDLADPERLGPKWLRTTRPRLDPAETALRRIEALGFRAGDVRDILLTHLDKDHAGGIGDFPAARVHVHAAEHRAAMIGTGGVHGDRYIAGQWAHDPHWAFYGEEGEDWFGFRGVRAFDDRDPEVLIVPIPGHTAGHCAIAVKQDDGWLLHAGDGYFAGGQMRAPPRTPLGVAIFQGRADTDKALRRRNQARLHRLANDPDAGVRVICSHDPDEFDQCCSAARPAVRAG